MNVQEALPAAVSQPAARRRGGWSPPLFPVAAVGSWHRPAAVRLALRDRRARRITAAECSRILDDSIVDVLRLQEDIGLDIVTDGELRRDDFCSFVADKLAGIRLLRVPPADRFPSEGGGQAALSALSSAFSPGEPVCVGPVRRREALVVESLRFLRSHTSRAVKVTLPGPYFLMQQLFVPSLSRPTYESREALAADLVRILAEELREIEREGADMVQFDEPTLTACALACGTSEAPKASEELHLAAALLNQVVAGAPPMYVAVHVCRGNWSADEGALPSGTYRPLAAYVDRVAVSQVVLECATLRAGDLVRFDGKDVGVGCVNPRSDVVETPSEVRRLVDSALELYPSERIFLNPDCGFSPFGRRPLGSPHAVLSKLRSMVRAAEELRFRHGARHVRTSESAL